MPLLLEFGRFEEERRELPVEPESFKGTKLEFDCSGVVIGGRELLGIGIGWPSLAGNVGREMLLFIF